MKFRFRPEQFTYIKETGEIEIDLNPSSTCKLMPSGIFRGYNILSPIKIKSVELYKFILNNYLSKLDQCQRKKEINVQK